MARIKYTKNELKKQKESLNRFTRFLPTLLLKKQQLQMEIRRIARRRDELDEQYGALRNSIGGWIGLLGEDAGFESVLSLEDISFSLGNIAGIDIPLFGSINIAEREYDLFETPLWFDRAVEIVRSMMTLRAELSVLDVQLERVREELAITSQRVNLFEKVKIPESRENIRTIKIYLGDQQTAEVVRGKISKKKIERRS